jgi:hypothetical protein
MSLNHHTPPPQARALCSAYAPSLALLGTNALEPDEARAVHEHLADCDWCQAKLATFDIVDAALRRHFGAAPDAYLASTLEEIMTASERDTSPTSTESSPSTQHAADPLGRRPQSRWTGLAAIAAVLLIVVLAGTLFGWLRHAGSATTPKPSVDPALQAYYTVLWTYYQPYAADLNQVSNACYGPYSSVGRATPAYLPQAVHTCALDAKTALTDGQTLSTRLAAASPPRSLQTADHELRQAIPATAAVLNMTINVANAHQYTQIYAELQALAAATTAYGMFSDPINTIDAALPSSDIALPTPHANAGG